MEEMGLLVAERTSAVAHSKEDLQEWRAKLIVPCRLGLCVCHLGLWHRGALQDHRGEECRCTPEPLYRLPTLP